MAARAQREQVQLEEFNLKGMKFTEDQSTTYVLIQSFIKQLTLVVKQCFFHACNKNDHLKLRPEAAIILQLLRCVGNVTSWNIRLYHDSKTRRCCNNAVLVLLPVKYCHMLHQKQERPASLSSVQKFYNDCNIISMFKM